MANDTFEDWQKSQSANGLEAVLGLNPGLAIFYQFLKAFDFFGGGGLGPAVELTPEQKIQRALEFTKAELDQAQSGQNEDNEGMGETFLDVVAQAVESGNFDVAIDFVNQLPQEYPGLTEAVGEMSQEEQVIMAAQNELEKVKEKFEAGDITAQQKVAQEAQILASRADELGLPDQKIADIVNSTYENYGIQTNHTPETIRAANGGLDIATDADGLVSNKAQSATIDPQTASEIDIYDAVLTDIQNPNDGQNGAGGNGGDGTNTDTTAQDEAIKNQVESIVNNPNMDDAAKEAAIQQVATQNGVDMGKIAAVAGTVLAGAGLGWIIGQGAGPGGVTDGDGADADADGATDDTGGIFGEDGIFGDSLIGGIISGLGSIGTAILNNNAIKDALEAQTAASNRALDIFERNAGLAQEQITNTSQAARDAVTGGATQARTAIVDSSYMALDKIASGRATARDDITTGRDQVRDDLITSLGLRKDEINRAAIASSGIISEARDAAIADITAGFGAGMGEVRNARDTASKIIQASADSAEERVDLARGNAIAAQDRGLKAIRADFEPYVNMGKVTAEGLEKLVNDPNEQRKFILDNPFFDEMANQTERRLLAKQAAAGRVGAGETQLELRNRLLEIGNQLLDSSINQRLALVSSGQQASGAVAQAEIARANAVSDIERSAGATLAQIVQSAGVNRANIEQNAGSQLADLNVRQGEATAAERTGAAASLADIELDRGKQIQQATGETTELGVRNEQIASTSLADIAANTSGAEADIIGAAGTNLAKIAGEEGGSLAKINQVEGINTANILTGNAAKTADITLGQGDMNAAAGIAGTSNLTGTIKDLTKIGLDATRKTQ